MSLSGLGPCYLEQSRSAGSVIHPLGGMEGQVSPEGDHGRVVRPLILTNGEAGLQLSHDDTLIQKLIDERS
jgi:hypothetical protein